MPLQGFKQIEALFTATTPLPGVACIGCNGTRVDCLGPLPVFTPDLLGRPRDGRNTLGALYRCRDCRLRFRWPQPTDDELLEYYRSQPSDGRWLYDKDRAVWRSIQRELEDSTQRSVLDIGCFRGDLLESLGRTWTRFGVEPAPAAAQVARDKGIEILGSTVEDFDAGGRRFGAVTLVDVIEHLRRPLDCLRKLTDLLLPCGKLIVFTGSTDAWSWRFAGLRYWYSAMPEHVAFFCPCWFRWAASRLGCAVTAVQRMPHRPAPWSSRMDESLKNLLYHSYHRLSGVKALGPALQRLPGLRRVGQWEGCWWTTARDHVLVTLTKTPSGRKGELAPMENWAACWV
jgi:SAM-dependent methyltransferase